jgi:hypothetical protein
MNIANVTVIDISCDINVLSENTFKKEIIKNTFESLKRMYLQCKKKLTIEHQIMIWQNLRILGKSIQKNIELQNVRYMDNEIQEIMQAAKNMVYREKINDESKKNFLEIKKNLSNIEFNRIFNKNLKYILDEIQRFENHFSNRSIDFDFIMKNIWTRDLANDTEPSITRPDNNIKSNNVIDSPRFKFFEEINKIAYKYLSNDENNTIGNIDSFCNIRDIMERKNTMHILINMIQKQ